MNVYKIRFNVYENGDVNISTFRTNFKYLKENADRIVEAGYELFVRKLVGGSVTIGIKKGDEVFYSVICATEPQTIERTEKMLREFEIYGPSESEQEPETSNAF